MKTRNLRRLSPALVLVLIHAAVAAGAAVPCQDADPKHALSGLQPFMTAEMEKAKLPGIPGSFAFSISAVMNGCRPLRACFGSASWHGTEATAATAAGMRTKTSERESRRPFLVFIGVAPVT